MKINYNSVRKDAKKLRALADDCETAARTCSKYQNELPQYWQGSAANSYAAGLARLNRKNKALARQIEQLAAQITTVANELEEEDRRLAARIAAKKVAGTTTTAKKTSPLASTAKAAATPPKTTGTPVVNPSAASIAKTVISKSGGKTLLEAAYDLAAKLFGKG